LVVHATAIEKEKVDPNKGPALVTASGYVVPRHKVEVSSKIIGRIKEVCVQRGDQVKQGDVLIRIDDEEYQARLRSAEAQVKTLQARVAELKAGSRPQEIEAARAAVRSSEASLKSARLDYDRVDSLVKQGALSRQELDRMRAAMDVAAARVDADRKNAELVKIGPRVEQIEAAEAQLHEAEANVEYVKTELSYTVIAAPITGAILEKLAEQGELVTNMNFGGTRGAKNSVVTMADLSDLQVEVDLNETDVMKVKRGQTAEIRLDSTPEVAYIGQVDELSPQADRQKGTVQVKVRILNPQAGPITTESNARVTFFGDPSSVGAGSSATTRLWVPKSAIQQDAQGASVFIVAGDKVATRTVKVGMEGEKGVEILEGLSGDERVVLSPLEKVSAGLRVTVAS
jgi:HlyD family secretion protein